MAVAPLPITMMTAERPDLLRMITVSGSRMCILGYNEYTTDLPEFSHFQPKDYWDARARGTGGSRRDPYCSCGEENLLGYPGDPYAAENILVHEFAHTIHLQGLAAVDPTFDRRLQETYESALADGKWKGTYAAQNKEEYWAEGVQSWFDTNRSNDHDHNDIDTRDELKPYDPRLAALLTEVFGDNERVGDVACRPDDLDPGFGMRLKIEPPGRFAVRPSVHRHRHQVRAVFEIAEDDTALLAGAAPDGGEAQGTPAARLRFPQPDPASRDAVQAAMGEPGETHEPPGRNPNSLRRLTCHDSASCDGLGGYYTNPNSTA